ncbi:MAG TPA: 50S ribosomal protein L30 [Candidatus Thermoplasmatota archaeon]|nr:50S ribosomal protein L30 [Candidatus Thermoplasmatota archaeon]
MVYAIIRVRGLVNINGGVQDTMRMLRLTRVNTLAIVPKDPSHDGMVKKIKDFVTYGELDHATLVSLMKARGRVAGYKPITDEFVKNATGGKHATIDAFAKAVVDGKAKFQDLGEDAKLYFRLHPPIGGYEAIKRHFTVGGSLGYRGKEINTLIKRMMPETVSADNVARGRGVGKRVEKEA